MNSSIDVKTKYKERKSTEFLVLHHSATTRKQRCDAFDIHRWHLDRGWSGIGYHFVIEKDGTLRSGRPLTAVGAHCKGYNDTSIGICMVGGLDKDGNVVDNFIDAQYKTLQTLVIMLQDIYPEASLIKHKQLADTLCNDVDVDRLDKHIR